ncbi:hypothetical protein J2X11_000241 [Aeromicrobium panaciterrae]|uniref:SnoaL-like domain-containing protein n=1 Tax=Aeromicrobium panaciterrae TaxID=363861 RepID=A0ABU1UJP4_9ACTN|nr:hypothetical protein [Aeromicrobium panaciterrae]MDR7085402.1 hypothetical protein [Aeromicrobium panaciterrae]
MLPDRSEVLALVRSSPAFVAEFDKAGWIDIFGSLHVVEDPVGSRPVRSSESGGLGRFWDTFIAPNKIEFEVVNDWIDGFDVVRDVSIVTTLRPGVVVRTPAHLLYETAFEDGVLKVRRMAAHWEPRPVYRQLMKPSRAHLGAAIGQFARMFRILGVVQSLQFIGASRYFGWRRKRSLRDALESEGISEVSKLIASGRVVTASCVVGGKPSTVVARYFRGYGMSMVTFSDLA